jgi:hypothetical protein
MVSDSKDSSLDRNSNFLSIKRAKKVIGGS